MPLTESQKQAHYNYAKKYLKRIPLDVQKYTYEAIKLAADSVGNTVNGFIKEAIFARHEYQVAEATLERQGNDEREQIKNAEYICENHQLLRDRVNGAKQSEPEKPTSEKQPEPAVSQNIRVFKHGRLKDVTPRSEIDFTMNSGETATGVVLEVNNGVAEMVFKNCLDKRRPMNKKNTNEGGFEASDLRKVLNSEILEDMPTWLREIMVPFENGDFLRLLREKELHGENKYGEPDSEDVKQFEMMKDRRYRIVFRGNTGEWEWYWVENAAVASSALFALCSSDGNAYSASASSSDGVRPRFRIRIADL